MDKLLMQTPHALEDEKTELFLLTDRFIKFIESYRKEYAAISANKESDLKKRDSDSKSALNKLAAAQAKEKKDRLDRLEASLKEVRDNIESNKRNTSAELGSIEADITAYEKQEKVALEDAYQNIM